MSVAAKNVCGDHQRGGCINETQLRKHTLKQVVGEVVADVLDHLATVGTDPGQEAAHVRGDQIRVVLEITELGTVDVTLADDQTQAAQE